MPSSQSFENATIGFVRNCKKFNELNRDKLLNQLREGLNRTGYFEESDVRRFVSVIENLIDYSDTRRENRKNKVR